MAQIIIDAGSGNTCRNDWDYAKRMIDELHAVNTGKHEVILKWQLFKKAGDNVPLDLEIFNKAYNYAETLGYQTTASVFDLESLEALLCYDVPFVKIANNRDLDYLIGEIPRRIPVYVSVADSYYPYEDGMDINFKHLACVSKYPTTKEEYEQNFTDSHLRMNISDHTANWDLFNEYSPETYECHYKLSDSQGLDAGDFARTPAMLAKIL